jgi:hypothetical protein
VARSHLLRVQVGALGDLGAGGVAHALQQVGGQLQAHVQHRELLAVLRHDPVGGPVDGVDTADRGRLLPGQRRVGAELAPPLERDRLGVDAPAEQHQP